MRRERALRIVLVDRGTDLLGGRLSLVYVDTGRLAGKQRGLFAEWGSVSMSCKVFSSPLAARDPSANRGVITFAAWLNIAHAAVMTVMSIHLPHERQDLLVRLSDLLPHRCNSDRFATSQGAERPGVDSIGSPFKRSVALLHTSIEIRRLRSARIGPNRVSERYRI